MIHLAALCAALSCASAAAPEPPAVAHPRPGLTVPPASVLPASLQSAYVHAVFRGNYPSLGVGFAEGGPAGLEFAACAHFDHARVDWPGAGGRHDSDEFQGALRWGSPVRAGRIGGAVALSAGFARGYDRTRLDDGRYSFRVLRSVWGEAVAGAGVVAGSRLSVTERWLRDVPTGTDIHAVVLSAESPAWHGSSLIGEVGIGVSVPDGWRRPWAAGLRLPLGRHAFDFFVSNTPAATVPRAFSGTDSLCWSLRLLLGS